MVTMTDDQESKRDALSALINRLEQADVQELARDTATWRLK